MFTERDFEVFAEAEPDPCKACNTPVDINHAMSYKNKLRNTFERSFRMLGEDLLNNVLKDRFGINLIFKTEESKSATIRPFFYATWAREYDGERRAQINIMISDDIKPEDQGVRTKKFSVKFCLYNKCKPLLPKNVDFDRFVDNIKANKELFCTYLIKASEKLFEVYNNEGNGYKQDYKPLGDFLESDVLIYFVEGPKSECTFQELRKNYYLDDKMILEDSGRLSLSIIKDIIVIYPLFLFASTSGQARLLTKLNEFNKTLQTEAERNVNIWNQNRIEDIITPQNWGGFCDMVDRRCLDLAMNFLSEKNRPILSDLSHALTHQVLDRLEELWTNPFLADDPRGPEVAEDTLSAFIEDFVKDTSFPQEGCLDIYWRLFQMWSEHKTGSVNERGWNVLLSLAQEVLSHSGKNQEEIAGAIQNWWHARKALALVPFVIEALEFLRLYTSDITVLAALWKEITPFIREEPTGYSPGEKSILRKIGKRVGYDEEAIRGSLGIEEATDDEAEDVLAHANFSKVAIVSLHERAASDAAKIIRQKTGASVIVVSEKVAGAQTNSAKTADVIIFVWAANKHAVYRAFDDVRDKLAYVKGVGKESIVLALERWVVNRLYPVKG